MSYRRRLPVIALVSVFTAGCGATEAPPQTDPVAAPPAATASEAASEVVTVHRSETCECCGGYEEHLEAQGFEVEVVVHDDVTGFKGANGIPTELWSCHTNEIGGYLAEGHVPVEALRDLVAEAPDADGIALAGMPAGSPGMPGEQEGPFVVESFESGDVTGEFGRY